MQKKIYTVEELMMNDSFLSYCLDQQISTKPFWENEMALHSEQESIFAEARDTIILLHGKLDDYEVNRQVEKIKKMIGDQEKVCSPMEKIHEPASQLHEPVSPQHEIRGYRNQKPAKHFRKAYFIYGIAASALVFLGLSLFNNDATKAITPQSKAIEVSYKSSMGERKTIPLPDGSVVVLNSNSSIRLAGDFNQKDRGIVLTGEAFFRVAKNPAKPFIVQSGDFSVTALGTSFYVRARNSENGYKVKLVEGKVSLALIKNKKTAPAVQGTILLPGEQGEWQSSKMSFTKSFCDSTVLKKWVSGKLSFKKIPVENALELLQQWYGVDIIVKHKKWVGLTLTGDYDNKPLDHVLKIICFSLSAGYSYSGNQVIIE